MPLLPASKKPVLAAAALALIWLTMLLSGGADSAFDPAILRLLYAGDRPALAGMARLLTELGSWHALVPFCLAAALWLAARRKYPSVALLAAVTLIGRAAVDLQKLAIMRLRPDLHEPLVHVVSSSFPSGHSANAAIVYGTLALMAGRPWARAVAAILAVAIGISRVMLGVHWPSDVIGGWAFGLLWLIGAWWLTKTIHPRASSRT